MKKIHIIGLLLIAVSIGYFIINLSEEASEYANFTTAIENPAGSGIAFIALIDSDKFLTYNFESILASDTAVLNIQYL
jgi:hypothetical protein